MANICKKKVILILIEVWKNDDQLLLLGEIRHVLLNAFPDLEKLDSRSA